MPTASLADFRTPRPWLILAGFLVLVVGVGALIGTASQPGSWYQSLEKPFFNPPDWVFGPVWFTLYLLIAIAGWRVFMIEPRSVAMGLWVAQMLLNWAWSPVWFVGEMLWPAFAIIVAMWLSILGFILVTWRRERVSALCFLPYLAWVSFAGVLNLSIAIMNS